MEHIVHQQLYEYLQQNNLITKTIYEYCFDTVDRGNTSKYEQQNDHWCFFY